MTKRLNALFLFFFLLFFAAACSPSPGGSGAYKPKGDLEKARALYNEGKYVEAEEELLAYLKKDPENARAFYYLGLVSIANYRVSDARNYFIKALQLNPSTEFCRAVQEIMMLDNSRVIGSGKGFWMAPAFLDSKRVVALAVTNDTDGDGAVSPRDNAALVHVVLKSRATAVLLDDSYIKGPPMPDREGKRVVYASTRRDTNGDGKVSFDDNAGIYLFDIESRKEKCIVPDDFHNADPSFSPDGKAVYFVSIRIDTNSDGVIDFNDNFAVYRLTLATGEIAKIQAMPGDCRRPIVSEDGSSLYFWGINEDANGDGAVNAGDPGGVFRYDLAEPSVEPVLSWRNLVNCFDFSVRGGKLIAVMDPWPGEGVSREEARKKDPEHFGPGIYIVDLVTGTRRKVVEPAAETLSQPALAPDGHTIAFQRIQDNGTRFVCYYYDTDHPWLTATELIKILKAAW